MAKIYISSTFSDLWHCRSEVYHALRSHRHEVIAMEDYVAADQRPVERCLDDVTGCDLYVGIFAFRYGYIPPDHNPDCRSITELEYRKAGDEGVPRLIFLLDPKAPWPSVEMDAHTEDGENGKRIRELREELQRKHVVTFFTKPESLATSVGAAVSNAIARSPSPRHRTDLAVQSKLDLQNGRLPLVQSVTDPRKLGVDPADDLDQAMLAEPRLATLPPNTPAYVSRDQDAALRRILATAAQRSEFVLVKGDSAAGKSRTAYEAMRAVLPDWRLFAPVGRAALAMVLDAGLPQRPCVVWLDDLEAYLDQDGLEPARLRALLVGSGVVALATMRSAEINRFDRRHARAVQR